MRLIRGVCVLLSCILMISGCSDDASESGTTESPEDSGLPEAESLEELQRTLADAGWGCASLQVEDLSQAPETMQDVVGALGTCDAGEPGGEFSGTSFLILVNDGVSMQTYLEYSDDNVCSPEATADSAVVERVVVGANWVINVGDTDAPALAEQLGAELHAPTCYPT